METRRPTKSARLSLASHVLIPAPCEKMVMARLEAPVGCDQRPHRTQPELFQRRGVHSQGASPSQTEGTCPHHECDNQGQVLSEGTIIGYGESAVWAATIEDQEPEPLQNKQFSKYLREVIAGARPNLSIREARSSLRTIKTSMKQRAVNMGTQRKCITG